MHCLVNITSSIFPQITYSIVDNITSFLIDPDTGEITSNEVFDRENVADSTITISIKASDGTNDGML